MTGPKIDSRVREESWFIFRLSDREVFWISGRTCIVYPFDVLWSVRIDSPN